DGVANRLGVVSRLGLPGGGLSAGERRLGSRERPRSSSGGLWRRGRLVGCGIVIASTGDAVLEAADPGSEAASHLRQSLRSEEEQEDDQKNGDMQWIFEAHVMAPVEFGGSPVTVLTRLGGIRIKVQV